jgi:hypothetical protein
MMNPKKSMGRFLIINLPHTKEQLKTLKIAKENMMQQVLQNLRNQEGQKEMTYIFKC